MALIEFSKKCPNCQTSYQICIYEYLWEEDWAYDWYGRRGRWEWWTKKFKVSKNLEITELVDEEFRWVEDLSPNHYQSMPLLAQFQDDPGPGGDIQPSTTWECGIKVEVLGEEQTDGEYREDCIDDDEDHEEDHEEPPHEFSRLEAWRENEKLIFKCEECKLEFEMRFPNS